MGKKKGSPNKSQAIRDFAKENTGMSPKDMATALGKQGVKGITPLYVSNVLSKAKAENTAKPPKTAKKKQPATATEFGLPAVEAAAEFITAAGGVASAKEAFAAAEKIAKKLQL